MLFRSSFITLSSFPPLALSFHYHSPFPLLLSSFLIFLRLSCLPSSFFLSRSQLLSFSLYPTFFFFPLVLISPLFPSTFSFVLPYFMILTFSLNFFFPSSLFPTSLFTSLLLFFYLSYLHTFFFPLPFFSLRYLPISLVFSLLLIFIPSDHNHQLPLDNFLPPTYTTPIPSTPSSHTSNANTRRFPHSHSSRIPLFPSDTFHSPSLPPSSILHHSVAILIHCLSFLTFLFICS